MNDAARRFKMRRPLAPASSPPPTTASTAEAATAASFDQPQLQGEGGASTATTPPMALSMRMDIPIVSVADPNGDVVTLIDTSNDFVLHFLVTPPQSSDNQYSYTATFFCSSQAANIDNSKNAPAAAARDASCGLFVITVFLFK